ncbi:GNAT family N-acetyltransferase, partial [Escherichia coli]|uniref:GNAT family N-acetyltransferase n=1 Tax=Escherichia coli TaxID=562 RepID=UPI003F293DAE
MDGISVGAAFMSDIDLLNRRASWAFYLADESTRGRGVGGAVEYLVLHHAFEVLGLHKLCCEVLSFNAAVV